MNYSCILAIFGSIVIGAGLLASSDLIAGLTDAGTHPKIYKRVLVKAKKLDVNNDGLISLDELTGRQNGHYQKLNRKADGQVDEAEFNARLVVMFKRMDGNSDGMLDDVEISKLQHHHHEGAHNSKQLCKNNFGASDNAASKTNAACRSRPTLPAVSPYSSSIKSSDAELMQ